MAVQAKAKGKGKADLGIKAGRVADVFRIASDPTRTTIIYLLSSESLCVGDMRAVLDQSQPTVSHHLALMRASGVVEPTRRGKNVFYDLTSRGRLLATAIVNVDTGLS